MESQPTMYGVVREWDMPQVCFFCWGMYIMEYISWDIYIYIYVSKLVGGLDHFLFSIIYGIIFPIDFHIFQDGYCTTNKKNITYIPVVCFTMMYIYIVSLTHTITMTLL